MDTLRDALLRGLRGQDAHVNPHAALEGLSAEQVGRKVSESPHTIWEILGHLVFWQQQFLTAVGGGTPAIPEHAEGGWPAKARPADEKELSDTLVQFSAGLREAEKMVTSANLDAPVPDILGGKAAFALGGLTHHNSYHLGQVVMLRRAIGAWPPPKGGITW